MMGRVAKTEGWLSLNVNDLNHWETVSSNEPFKVTFKSPLSLGMRPVGVQKNSVSQAMKLLTNEKGMM